MLTSVEKICGLDAQTLLGGYFQLSIQLNSISVNQSRLHAKFCLDRLKSVLTSFSLQSIAKCLLPVNQKLLYNIFVVDLLRRSNWSVGKILVCSFPNLT